MLLGGGPFSLIPPSHTQSHLGGDNAKQVTQFRVQQRSCNAFEVILLALALSFLVVMTLNDRCAGNSAQSHGNGHLPRIYGVNWHWLLIQIFSQTSAAGTQPPRPIVGKEFSLQTRNFPCYKFASHRHI